MAESIKTRQRIWVYPTFDCDCDCSETEAPESECPETTNNAYHLTYEIPGVEKENIHLKVIKNAVRLVAHKDNIDYINEFVFQCNVDVKGTLAAYENGVLTIDAPYDCPDPFKEAGLFKIN